MAKLSGQKWKTTSSAGRQQWLHVSWSRAPRCASVGSLLIGCGDSSSSILVHVDGQRVYLHLIVHLTLCLMVQHLLLSRWPGRWQQHQQASSTTAATCAEPAAAADWDSRQHSCSPAGNWHSRTTSAGRACRCFPQRVSSCKQSSRQTAGSTVTCEVCLTRLLPTRQQASLAQSDTASWQLSRRLQWS